jgi:hypothetical protein
LLVSILCFSQVIYISMSWSETLFYVFGIFLAAMYLYYSQQSWHLDREIC